MTVQPIAPAQARRLLDSGEAILIDVREPDEFRKAHIPGAVPLPLGSVASTLRHVPRPRDRTIIFQCEKGTRGARACQAAVADGIDPAYVRNLDGGIAAWRDAGLPVAGAGDGGISIFRQVQMTVGLLVLAAVIAGLTGFRPAFYLAALFGAMLAVAGVTGWCGLALLLARMPWNRA